jgi:hypothetical protein
MRIAGEETYSRLDFNHHNYQSERDLKKKYDKVKRIKICLL